MTDLHFKFSGLSLGYRLCIQSSISKSGQNQFVRSVQSALSDLLTTSATHGTFSRQSTKRGLILIGLELNTNARSRLNIADQ